MRIRPLLALLLLLCTPALAAAQRRPAAAAQPAAAQPAGDRPAPSASPYNLKVANGIRLLVARDFDGAIASFREAVALESSNPVAHYYIGEAQRMKGEMAEAVEAFRTAARFGAQGTEHRWTARALQGVADTLERIPERVTDARQAWMEYTRFADQHRDVSFPEMARQRIQAIDTWTELELTVVDVRRRIEERERAAASGGSGGTGGTGGGARPAGGGGR